MHIHRLRGSYALAQNQCHNALRFDPQFIFDRVRKLIEPHEIVLPTRVSDLARRIIERDPSIGIKGLSDAGDLKPGS